MNYKRICTILGVILIVSCATVCINKTKESIVHTKQIESKLNFSQEDKGSLNYNKLVKDIKSVEDGKGLKYAKSNSSESSSSGGSVKLVMESKEYQGDGYTVKLPPVTDVVIYEFYKGNNCVYSACINNWFGPGELKEAENKNIKNMIVYGFIGLIAVLEVVFLCLYRLKNKKVKNDEILSSNIEDKEK